MPRLNRASFLSIQVCCSVKPNLLTFAPCIAISFLSLFLVCDNKFLKTLPTSHFLLKILKVYWPRGKCTPNTVLKMGMALFRPMANRRRLRKQTGHLTLDINCNLPDLMLNRVESEWEITHSLSLKKVKWWKRDNGAGKYWVYFLFWRPGLTGLLPKPQAAVP